MEINKLKTFVNLAKTLSFSETAHQLFLSQSNVSKQIKSLENELNVDLFIRNQRKVSLTDYGKSLLPNAKEIIAKNDQALAQLQKIKKVKIKKIKIGVIPTFWNYDIHQKILLFKKLHPNIEFIIKEYEMERLPNLLEENNLDFAFIRSQVAFHPNNNEILLNQESFCACVNSTDPLAGKKIIKVTNLMNRPFLLLSKSSLLYQSVIELCETSGFTPTVIFTSNRIDSILKMIKNHEGISILMHHPGEKDGLKFIPLKPTRKSNLLMIRNPQSSGISNDTFWNYLKK